MCETTSVKRLQMYQKNLLRATLEADYYKPDILKNLCRDTNQETICKFEPLPESL